MIKVKVYAEELRERTNPSGKWNGKYIPIGIYDVLNDMEYNNQRWVQVKDNEAGYVWIAVNDEWNKVYELEDMYEDKYNNLLNLVDEFLTKSSESTVETINKFKEEMRK